jgi:hypothetical protein
VQEDLYDTFQAARVGGVNLFDTAEVVLVPHLSIVIVFLPRLG